MRIKNIGIGLFYTIIFYFFFFEKVKQIDLSEIVTAFSLGSFVNHKSALNMALVQLLYIIFAFIMYGNNIYSDFCNAAAYFFVRKKNIQNWFLRATIKLYLSIISYVVVCILFIAFLCFCTGILTKCDLSGILLVVYHIIIYSIYIFTGCLVINLLSILLNSGLALGIVSGLNLLFLAAYLITGDIYDDEAILNNSWIFRINPLCHIILRIHKTNLEKLKYSLYNPLINQGLISSVFIIIASATIVCLFGIKMVSKLDILGDRLEG